MGLKMFGGVFRLNENIHTCGRESRRGVCQRAEVNLRRPQPPFHPDPRRVPSIQVWATSHAVKHSSLLLQPLSKQDQGWLQQVDVRQNRSLSQNWWLQAEPGVLGQNQGLSQNWWSEPGELSQN